MKKKQDWQGLKESKTTGKSDQSTEQQEKKDNLKKARPVDQGQSTQGKQQRPPERDVKTTHQGEQKGTPKKASQQPTRKTTSQSSTTEKGPKEATDKPGFWDLSKERSKEDIKKREEWEQKQKAPK